MVIEIEIFYLKYFLQIYYSRLKTVEIIGGKDWTPFECTTQSRLYSSPLILKGSRVLWGPV